MILAARCYQCGLDVVISTFVLLAAIGVLILYALIKSHFDK